MKTECESVMGMNWVEAGSERSSVVCVGCAAHNVNSQTINQLTASPLNYPPRCQHLLKNVGEKEKNGLKKQEGVCSQRASSLVSTFTEEQLKARLKTH